ncbi:MAG: DUF4384 domain-containing protein [Desulfobacterales bacterium]|nr:DUF4384 domain-containing protein [Desulfobacterales bacterium]
MKRYRLFFRTGVFLLAIGAISLGMANGAAADNADADNIYFSWAFVAKKASGENQSLIPITRDTELKSGDQLQMLIQLQKSCFVYLFYKSAGNDLHLLFPYSFGMFDGSYNTTTKYYMPKDKSAMYTLNEDVGLETFYLLVSETRQTQLEEMFNNYGAFASREEKDAAVKKIVAEIRALRKKNMKFKAAAERPVTIGGSVRGSIEDYMVEIKAKHFYGRSFTIDHK